MKIDDKYQNVCALINKVLRIDIYFCSEKRNA